MAQVDHDSSELPPIIGAMTPGTRVDLGVMRDGKPRTVRRAPSLDERAAAATMGTTMAAEPDRPGRTAKPNPLGLVGEDLDGASDRKLGLEPGEGVVIARVEGMAAREAGMRPGDVVLAVGRDKVGSPGRPWMRNCAASSRADGHAADASRRRYPVRNRHAGSQD